MQTANRPSSFASHACPRDEQVGQAEELASCLLAMPVGSAKQKAEAMQFLKDFLGDSSVRFLRFS